MGRKESNQTNKQLENLRSWSAHLTVSPKSVDDLIIRFYKVKINLGSSFEQTYIPNETYQDQTRFAH